MPKDDQHEAQLKQLAEELMFAVTEVDSAIEAGDETGELETGRRVEALVARYKNLLETVDPDERQRIELQLDRRVMDLRRAAAQLSQRASGVRVAMARDAGSVPFLEQRAPGRSIVPERAAPSRQVTVGGEIDSWCGKCKDMRTHRVVAMVSDTPKQVVCDACDSRHSFRAEPPTRSRAAATSMNTRGNTRRSPSADELEQQRRQDARRVLQKELAECAEPRAFDPRGRYKAGEILQHPEHGRGKIENVLRTSLLVRFLEGLRPVDLA